MYDKHGDIIYSADIERRIEQLWQQAVGTPIIDWDEDLRDEYNALASFSQAVRGEYGHDAWDRGISFVSDHYKSAYANEIAEERFGSDTVHHPAWSEEVHEETFYADWKEFDLDDVTYYTDGSR